MSRAIDKKYLTGSYYFGSGNSMGRMDGYGTYTYPDGSQYRGYFKEGLFNGHGKLTLGRAPKMHFKGTFEDGRLTDIDYICFEDGLYFRVEKKPGTANECTTKNWRYCSAVDRRFYRETYSKLEWPAKTAREKTRFVDVGYDTEEGVFRPLSGFVTNLETFGPYKCTRFVECAEDVEWIKENCRSARPPFETCQQNKFGAPVHPVCPKIVENNLDAMRMLQGLADNAVIDECPCNDPTRYFDCLDAKSADRRDFTAGAFSSELDSVGSSSLESYLRHHEVEVKPSEAKTRSNESASSSSDKIQNPWWGSRWMKSERKLENSGSSEEKLLLDDHSLSCKFR